MQLKPFADLDVVGISKNREYKGKASMRVPVWRKLEEIECSVQISLASGSSNMALSDTEYRALEVGTTTS